MQTFIHLAADEKTKSSQKVFAVNSWRLSWKWVLWFDLIYNELRSIIIWSKTVEEEASREEGTDFSKGGMTSRKLLSGGLVSFWVSRCDLTVKSKRHEARFTKRCKIIGNCWTESLLYDLFVSFSTTTKKQSSNVDHAFKNKATWACNMFSF